IFADIDKKRKPNVVLDITRGTVKDKSIDVVNAIEVFEHVEEPEKGLRECHRILKEDGLMIVSAPFLFPIHAPARDFQRWTEGKWKKELEIAGFKIEKFETMGYFFTVLMDMIASFIRQLPLLTGCMFKLLYPFMNLLVGLDRYRLVRDNNKLNKYTTGYFMILSRK
ncbi:MAG: methyltransferase domain-containing protein, partial [bacterium]